MNFTKESKKFYVSELKGEITNNFDFSVKSLHNVSNATEQKVNRCKSCKLPLTASLCIFCQTDNGLPLNENSVQNFICKEVFPEKEPMKQSMILCIDLSGSMSLTYKSKYQKINQQFVKRVLGEKNFDYLKKKIGVQRVLKNYTIYQMFLKEGQSARSIAEMVKMEESQSSVSLQKNSSNIIQKQEKQKSEQYISRKQIVEIAVEKCIQIVKNRCPNTQITVVYFNQTIQIPTDNFIDKIQISGIESKTVEEMISLGVQYSNFISRDKATSIGQSLLMNLTNTNQNGQTALGPSLAFCFGLAQAFKNSLSQIIVITDGMSNIGFGQTENQLQQDLAKQFYEKLALKYAKPLNCIVNVMTFEDCCIGYDQLDRLIEVTGGIPCQIEFTQEGGQNMVTEETFSSLSFKMITAFCEYASRLCFNTKITICCSNQKVKLSVSKDLEHFLQLDKGNLIRLNAGVISNSFNIQVTFSLDEQVEDCQGVLNFMIICQFDKNNKRYTSVTVDKIKIVKGTKVQAEKEETLLLQKQIKEKLRPRQIFEQDIKQYSSISMKILQNKSLMQNLDKELLEKFKKKKQKLENLYKNIDKLSREKMSMRSRAEKTYKGGQDDFDDGFK